MSRLITCNLKTAAIQQCTSESTNRWVPLPPVIRPSPSTWCVFYHYSHNHWEFSEANVSTGVNVKNGSLYTLLTPTCQHIWKSPWQCKGSIPLLGMLQPATVTVARSFCTVATSKYEVCYSVELPMITYFILHRAMMLDNLYTMFQTRCIANGAKQ